MGKLRTGKDVSACKGALEWFVHAGSMTIEQPLTGADKGAIDLVKLQCGVIHSVVTIVVVPACLRIRDNASFREQSIDASCGVIAAVNTATCYTTVSAYA